MALCGLTWDFQHTNTHCSDSSCSNSDETTLCKMSVVSLFYVPP